jgi:hypothetical protein
MKFCFLLFFTFLNCIPVQLQDITQLMALNGTPVETMTLEILPQEQSSKGSYLQHKATCKWLICIQKGMLI